MTIKIHDNVTQGSDEWIEMRRGILTASEMKLIITPTLKVADNDKSRSHCNELLAQRLTKYVEPHYISDEMLRGQEEEIYAKEAYAKNYAPIKEVGFITNDKFGFIIGYSPDGLVGEDGLFECKSRCQKYQMEVILDGEVPTEHLIQVQTGLLVSERKWLDYATYSGGLPMETIRVFPNEDIQTAILNAAVAFDKALQEKLAKYNAALANTKRRFVATERRIEQEIHL